jgi:hypothetical protein
MPLLHCALPHSPTVVPNVENSPKHKFAEDDFTSFSMKIHITSVSGLPAFHIQNLSNRCSLIRQFQKNFESHFWRAFAI